MTQKEIILDHLEKVGTITPMEAYEMYGITRLGGIVYFLRKDGHDVKSRLVSKTNRYGKECHISEYWMEAKA